MPSSEGDFAYHSGRVELSRDHDIHDRVAWYKRQEDIKIEGNGGADELNIYEGKKFRAIKEVFRASSRRIT